MFGLHLRNRAATFESLNRKAADEEVIFTESTSMSSLDSALRDTTDVRTPSERALSSTDVSVSSDHSATPTDSEVESPISSESMKGHSRPPMERSTVPKNAELQRNSIYSKLALAIVPPLLYLGLSPTNEKQDYFNLKGNDTIDTKDIKVDHDDIDIAHGMEERPLNYLLSILQTAYTGSSLHKLKEFVIDDEDKKFVEKYEQTPGKASPTESPGSLDSDGGSPQAVPHSTSFGALRSLSRANHHFYGVYDSDSEDEEPHNLIDHAILKDGHALKVDEKEDHGNEVNHDESSKNEINLAEAYDEEEENKNEVNNEEAAGKESDPQTTISPMKKLPIEDVSKHRDTKNLRTDVDSDGDSIDTFHTTVLRRKEEKSKLDNVHQFETISTSNSSDKTVFIKDQSKITPFQKSILQNLKPNLISEGLLVTRKDNSDDITASDDMLLRIANKLQRVFELDDDDHFYGNFNAWLIKDVLLQGHLYLTRDCILFFAFLPKKYSNLNVNESGTAAADILSSNCANPSLHDDSDVIIQSGSLGLKTAKYVETVISSVIVHRFWAILRPQTLSIYSSSTDLYFPNIVIDLKSCLRVELEKGETKNSSSPSWSTSNSPQASRRGSGDRTPRPSAENLKRLSTDSLRMSRQSSDNFEEDDLMDVDTEAPISGYSFKLFTKKKTYKFHTDNLYSARQWCRNLTKIIFQLNNSNEGDEVLLKIPISNVIDFDKNTLLTKEVEVINGDDDEDLPSTFNVTYYDDEAQLPSKKRKKTPTKAGLHLDTNYFAFFNDGDKFHEQFHEVIELSKAKVMEKVSLLDRAKGKLRKDKSKNDRAISTLQLNPDSKSIIKQLDYLNNHLRAVPVDDENIPKEEPSTLKKIGRTINPTKIFKRSTSASDLTTCPVTGISPIYDKSEIKLLSSGWSPAQVINLPRTFTIETLRNLKMTFETSRKDIGVAEDRYNTVEMCKTISKNETIASASTHESEKSLTESSHSKPPPPILTPLNLRDPSEYQPKAKFQLKKNIKAFSNVSNMWSANPSHFGTDESDSFYIQSEATREVSQENFEEHFSFSGNKKLVASYYAHLLRSIPVYGKVYIGTEDICFRSLLPGVSTKMILPLRDVDNCHADKGMKITYSGLRIVILGHDGINVEFSSKQSRDDCEKMILQQLELYHRGEGWTPETHDWGDNYSAKKIEARLGDERPNTSSTDELVRLATLRIENARIKMFEDKLNAAAGLNIPIILEDSPFFKTEVKPPSLNVVLLTIGSRGDVQPYIALGKGLIDEGHSVTIATHVEFKDWILSHGIKFKEIAGDPSELMSLMVTHGLMSVGFLKEASTKFRGWIGELLLTSWEACQGCDILIESPSAMGGVHIAEALGIPYMRAFTMPWTRTKTYPHAFIVPEQKKGGSYNYLTHVIFENIFWKGISGQVNKWRVNELDLPKTNLYRLQQYKIPFLYNVSPSIFPASVDFPDWVKVTGYWFLDEGNGDYDPPVELVEFLNKARLDGKKVIYIGFGSIVVSDAKSLTEAIVEAVLDADVRCILNKGWSDRLSENKNEPEIELPAEVYNAGAIPHDWLFTRVDAAVHHGGSGTTGATVRSGLPTIIKPFFGDQFFYASRIEEVGVGIALKKLNAKSLSKAITTVTKDLKMIERAKKLSNRVRQENGVAVAIESIYSEFEYARTLIQSKQKQNEIYRHQHPDLNSGALTPVVYEESEYEEEEEDDDDDESNYGYGEMPDKILMPRRDFSEGAITPVAM